MPKMKSHSACKKRFKKVGNGKFKRGKAYKRHHAWAKASKQNRQLGEIAYLEGSEAKRMEKLLPY